ncbi:MAG: alpha/beta hydrolase [Caulobacter sp.]|nr:alpha/beta hydrolase [Caulobacter sp.]
MQRLLSAALAAAAILFAFTPQSAAQAAAPAPVVHDLGRFTVEVQGQGPDVILIPGLASPREVWGLLAPDLTRTHRVHLVQIAGFAGLPAGPNAEGVMLGPIVEALHAYILRERLAAPAVIGHSLGGLLGLQLAQAHPSDVGRLMIIDAVPYLSAMNRPDVTPEAALVGAAAMRDGVAGMPQADFAAMQAGSARFMVKTAEWQPKVAAWTLATDRQVMARAMYEDLIGDARPGLAGMSTPVTVLYAWDEAMRVPPEAMDALYARNYQGLVGVKLVRIDGAFHFLMLDQPARLAVEVGAFLR